MNLILKLIRFFLFNYTFLHKKNALYVILFHKVNDLNETFYKGIPTKTFQKLILYFEKYFQIIHFEDLKSEINVKKRKKPLMIITFDDGMKDIETHVYGFFKKNNIKFTVNIDTLILETTKPQYFVQLYDILNNSNTISSYFDTKYMESEIHIKNNSPIEVENQFTLLLSKLSNIEKEDFISRMIEKLNFQSSKFSSVIYKDWIIENKDNDLIRFGSHTHSHPVLDQINAEEVDFELDYSKKILQDLLDEEIVIFAYPNGVNSNEIDTKTLEKGYKFILKTDNKINVLREKVIPSSYYRINQYHQSFELAILHTFGILNFFRKLKNFGN